MSQNPLHNNHTSMTVSPMVKYIVRAIFDKTKSGVEVKGKFYPIKIFGKGGVRLRGMDIGKYRYVEQNPNTSSQYAEKARAGHQIVWVFVNKENRYISLIEDGIVHEKVKGIWFPIGTME